MNQFVIKIMYFYLYWSFYFNYNEFSKEKLYENDYNKFRPIII